MLVNCSLSSTAARHSIHTYSTSQTRGRTAARSAKAHEVIKTHTGLAEALEVQPDTTSALHQHCARIFLGTKPVTAHVFAQKKFGTRFP